MTKKLWVVLLSLIVFLGITLYYYPFISDDSFISMRYTQLLLEGTGLTWNDNDRVEGFSNLLWVVFTSFLGLLMNNLLLVVRLLGFLTSLWVLFIYYKYDVIHKFEKIDFPTSLIGLLFVATSITFSVWIIGGDIFSSIRHFMIVVVLLGYLVLEILRLKKFTIQQFHVIITLHGLNLFMSCMSIHNMASKARKWEFECRQIGEILIKQYGEKHEQPLIAVTATGAIPYYSKLPTLDMFGLNNKYTAKQKLQQYKKLILFINTKSKILVQSYDKRMVRESTILLKETKMNTNFVDKNLCFMMEKVKEKVYY